MSKNPFHGFQFVKSCAKLSQLPSDSGREVAFIGRSNAGKSSALNAITEQSTLARTSKTPGRTQLINLFATEDDDKHRLVDLPGYGYAKVPEATRAFWSETLPQYFASRRSLRALMLIMDIRHPLKPMDMQMLAYLANEGIPAHILLTKADKFSRSEQNKVLAEVEKDLWGCSGVTLQVFSATHKVGLDAAREALISHLYGTE